MGAERQPDFELSEEITFNNYGMFTKSFAYHRQDKGFPRSTKESGKRGAMERWFRLWTHKGHPRIGKSLPAGRSRTRKASENAADFNPRRRRHLSRGPCRAAWLR